MEYKEILDSARTCIGPYCKACPVCNGKACGNQVPGPGAKAPPQKTLERLIRIVRIEGIAASIYWIGKNLAWRLVQR